MKTVEIIQAFTGYPTPEGGDRRFAAGDQVELSNEFADLIVGKGHAKAIAAPKNERKKDVDA